MTRTNPKGHQASKRSAEGGYPGSRRSKRNAAAHGQLSASAESAVALSQEELFKLRNAAEFDDCNTETLSKEAQVKDEPTGSPSRPTRGTQSLANSPKAVAPEPRIVRSSPATPTAHADSGAAFTDVNDRHNVLDALLSSTFNLEMTTYVVEQILQDAQDSAGRGNEFGIAYIEAQIERLQRKGTSPSCVDEVIQLFQRGLRDLSDKFHSRISSVGGQAVRLDPFKPKDAPSVIREHQSGHHVQQQHGTIPERSSTRLQSSLIEVASISQRNFAAFEATHGQSDGSASSSDEEEDTPSHKISRYLDNDNEEYHVDGDDSPESRSQCSGDTSTFEHTYTTDQFPALTNLLLGHSPSQCWQRQAIWH